MKKRSLLMLISGILFISGSFVSCDKNPIDPTNTLKVSPPGNISFAASGNADVEITVTTDAKSWNFTKPDWITATKSGDKLFVNAEDNTTGSTRVGRLEITAGTADPAVINIMQTKEGGGVEPDPDAVAGSLQDKSGKRDVSLLMEDATLESSVSFSIADTSDENADINVFLDKDYLIEYNFLNGMECELFPESLITIAGQGNTVIPAGSTASGDIAIEMDFDSDLVEYAVSYLIPLYVKANSTNVSVNDDCRVNYVVRRKSQKEVRNVLYFEVNDTNPLNALEYTISGGNEPFFDAVVLFSGNINYNTDEDVVYLHNNPNVKALLDESDVYLQPLRNKGIKVYIGVLGNHDPAGVCQLSDWGARQFALELANAVDYYKLDGVSFDDEYSDYPEFGNKWFASSPSAAAGARLCYETKIAMREVCGEDKDVMIFYWGNFNPELPAVDGNEPGTFVDLAVANYGLNAVPVSGGTKKQCSGLSVELNRGSGTWNATEVNTRRIKGEGYGWLMWFALNPDPASHTSTYPSSVEYINEACKGLYDKDLKSPTHYYKKISEGRFDPVRYAY